MIRSLLRLRLCFSNEEEEAKSNSLCDGMVADSSLLGAPAATATATASATAKPVVERFQIPNYKSVSRRNCPLLKFLWDRDWPRVLQRMESHPQEARCVTEPSKRTALHLASFNHGCPLVVAQALLRANVHALYVEDSRHWTPLHYACSFHTGTDHLVPLFCQTLEELHANVPGHCALPVMVARTGIRSPLLLACHRNAPISVLCALLVASSSSSPCFSGLSNNNNNKWIAPVTGSEPYWYDTQDFGMSALSPLAVLVNQYLDLEDSTRMADLYNLTTEELERCVCSSAPFQDFDLDNNNETISVVRKVLLLLQHKTSEQYYDGSPLHIACSLKVSIPSLATMVGTILPHQATVRDSRGCTPLHHVLQNPHSPRQLLCNILAIRREACTIPTSHGTYPLLLALHQGWDWETGISDLVRASPATLDTCDPTTGLVPCWLAASVDADVTTIFELLRSAPHHVGVWESS